MRITLLIVAIAALVGCGAGSSAPAQPPSQSASLRITVWPEGREAGGAQTWTLRCGPSGGTLPRAAAACRKLAALTRPFRPTPATAVCTEIYGGPQQASIVGTHRGARVLALLSARNGCEIARAQRLGFLVPGFGTS